MSALFHVQSRCPLNGQLEVGSSDRCSNCGLEPLHTLILEPALWMGRWVDPVTGPMDEARLEIHPAGLTVSGVHGGERHWPWHVIRRLDAAGDSRWAGRLEVQFENGTGSYHHHPLAIDLLPTSPY